MKRIIFFFLIEGKMREVREIMKDAGDFSIVSMKEAGIKTDVEENGKSYIENALIKARAVKDEALRLGMKDFLVMSDDSGFEVDKLNKEPGIYSARYMGEDTSYDIKNAEILRRMEGVAWEDRTAPYPAAGNASRTQLNTSVTMAALAMDVPTGQTFSVSARASPRSEYNRTKDGAVSEE